MQTQPPIKKKRIPYGSIFVAIGCLLIIIRVILYYIPAKPALAPNKRSFPTGQVSKQTENKTPVSISDKEDIASAAVSSQTFRLTAGTTQISLPITGGSLLSILTDAQKHGEIVFSGKEYSGLGFFVTEIGSLKQQDGKYLMYSINSKEASVGVSLYVPKNGDVIVWELK
jgi:hypothetical protein